MAVHVLYAVVLFVVSSAFADVNQCSRTGCNRDNDNSCTPTIVYDFWAGQSMTWPNTTSSAGLLQMVPDVCQTGFHAFDGRCWAYSFGLLGVPASNDSRGLGQPSRAAWADAENICLQFGADSVPGCHLASVHTMRETCYVYEKLPGHPYYYTTVPTPVVKTSKNSYSTVDQSKVSGLIKDKRAFNDYNGCHSNTWGWHPSTYESGVCWLGLDQKQGTEGIAYAWNDLTKYDKRPRRNNGFTPWGGSETKSATTCYNATLGDMINTKCCSQFPFDPTYGTLACIDSGRYSQNKSYGLVNCAGSCGDYYYEPNNIAGGTEDCTHIWDRDSTQGEWNDEPCANVYPYVCNKIARCRQGFWRSQSFIGMPVRRNTAIVDVGVNSSLYNMGMCTQCAAGTWHSQLQDYEKSCFQCDPGRYGYPGAISSSCTAACPIGSYCESGTSNITIQPCPPGTYNPSSGGVSVAACLTTPAGYFTAANASSFSSNQCRAGVCGSEKQSDSNCGSTLCPAGYSCGVGTTCFNTTVTVTIPPPIKYPQPCNSIALFAPQGQSQCTPVSTGYYTLGGTNTTRTGQDICPPGFYCQGGAKITCPVGTYSNVLGSSSVTDCKPCSGGYFCPAGSTSPTQESCFLAFPTPNAMNISKVYYCPANTTQRLTVSAGYYTVPATDDAANTRSGQLPCNSSQVCIDGEAFNKIEFAPGACSPLAINENSVVAFTGRNVTGVLHSALTGKGYTIAYALESFTLASDLIPSLANGSCDPATNAAPYSNAGIFAINSATAGISLTRTSFPSYLNYEPTNAAGTKCPLAGVRYDLKITATASGESTVTKITCAVRIIVNDQNDAPYWPMELNSSVFYRAVPERSVVNTPVGRCDSTAALYGCPVVHPLNFAIELKAADEDYFSILRYSFVLGKGSAVNWTDADNPFRINSCSGLISMKNDKQISFLTNKVYNLTVQVQDDGNGGQFPKLSAEATVIIFILDAPDPPVLDDPSLYDFVVYENYPEGQLIGHVHAVDPDIGAVTYYRLNPPIDGDAFYMDASSNIRTTSTGAANIDFESTKKTYLLSILAFDCTPTCPGLSDTKQYTVRVLNTNDPPRFIDVASFYIQENSNDGSPVCFDSSGSCSNPGLLDRVQTVDVDGGGLDNTTYSLINGTDVFVINSTSGQISTKIGAKPRLNFEDETLNDITGTGRSFHIVVRATSSGLNSDPAYNEMTYTIYLVDVNEPPQITQVPSFFALESAPIGSACDPENVTVSLLTAVDPDNADKFLRQQPAPMQRVTFSRVSSIVHPTNDDGGALFSILDQPTGAAIKVSGTLDFESAPGGAACGTGKCYIIRVRATDDGAPSQFDETWVKIRIVDVNDGPTFPAPLTRSFSVSENVTSSVVQVAGPYAATDGDANDPLYYSIVAGSGQNFFDVVSGCGGLCFNVYKKSGITFDYESSQTSFSLTVQVTDQRNSKFIGQGCSNVNNVLSGCDSGTLCLPKNTLYQTTEYRCYENCSATTDGLVSIPRKDVFFCDYSAIMTGSQTPSGTPFQQNADQPLRLNIAITDWNDPPYIIGDNGVSGNETTCLVNSSVSYSKQNTNQIAIAQLRATDVDTVYAAAPFTYQKDNPSDTFWSTFDLNSTSGSIGIFPTVVNNNNTDKFLTLGQQFTARVRVLDEFPHAPYAPQMSSTCQIAVTVVAQNTRPNMIDPAPFSILEGSLPGSIAILAPNFSLVDPDVNDNPPDHLTFSMSDSPYFSLNSVSSELSLAGQPLDYEELAGSSFRQILVVRVQDSFGADDVALVTINVKDRNEAPKWIQSTLAASVLENVTSLTPVLDLKPLAPDPDTFADGITVFKNTSFAIISGCNATCPFELVPPATSGMLRVKSNQILDYEGQFNSWAIVIRATDGGNAAMFEDATVQVNIANVNEPPTIATGVQISVPEGSSGQFLADLSTLVSDPDAIDPINLLQINVTSGDPTGVFVITGGKLFVSSNGVLDYEGTRQYNLNITVTDTGGLQATGAFRVDVTNVNDVTITSVNVLTSDGLLSCTGTSRVRIIGTNFGLVSMSPAANVTVRFHRPVSLADPVPPIRFAQNCSVVINNTVIDCDIPATAGANLLVDVFISVPSTVINGDSYTDFSTIARSAVPSVTAVSGASNLATSGGLSAVNLTGTCFGTAGDQVTFGSLLATSFNVLEFCEFSSCVALSNCGIPSPTLISCTNAIPPGLGSNLRWKVRILGQSQGAYFTQGAYAIPALVSINNATLPTSGDPGTAPYFVLTGSNFGALNSVPQSAYFTYSTGTYNFINCVVTVAYTTVVCRYTDPGVGINMRAYIQFGNQLSLASPFVLNFTQPSVALISGQGAVDGSTIGGQFVTLTGANFGPACGLPGASVDAGGVNCPLVVATYGRGSISTTTGLPIIYTATPCAVMSQTQIVCATAPGTGAGHTWKVVVGGQQAFMPPSAGTTSYGSPVVATYDGVGATLALTNGGQSINIQGSNFGPVGGAFVLGKYGNRDINPTEFTSPSCAVTKAHTQITCTTAPGAGNELNWVVTVDGQLGRNELTNYASPALISTSLNPFDFLDNDGGNSFTVYGSNFGPAGLPGPYLESATYGPPNFAFAAPANCIVTTHTAMSCTIAAGSGTGLVMVVTVKGQVSPPSPFSFSYRPPNMTGGLLPVGAEKRTEGGALMFINGQGFSLCDPKSTMKILWKEDVAVLGATNKLLDISSVWDATGIVQNPPCPIGSTAQVGFVVPEMNVARSVTIKMQVSSSAFGTTTVSPDSITFTYDNPVLTSIFAEASAVNFGGVRVSLFGNNFCKSESCCQTYLDNVPVPIDAVVSHSHSKIIVEVTKPGALFVRCGTLSSNALSFTTNSPFVFGTVPQLGAKEFLTKGNETFEIWGLYFGDTYPNVTLNGTSIEVVAHTTRDCYDPARPATAESFAFDSGAVCYRTVVRTPAGTGRNLKVEVNRGATKSLADDVRFEFLSYYLPSIQTVSGTAFAAPMSCAGGGEIDLTGANFGVTPGQILIGDPSKDPISCVIIKWTDSSATCTVSEGEGTGLPITIYQASNNSVPVPGNTINFRKPSAIDFDNSTRFDTVGGNVLELVGQDFGRENRSSVTVGGLLCPLLYSNRTYARCLFPEGEGVALPVTLSAGGQGSTAVKVASYAPPMIYSVTPNSSLPTAGGLLFVITGKNFGINRLRVFFDTFTVAQRFLDPDPTINKDSFIYPGTNHTQLLLLLPEFFGAVRSVSISVRNQISVNSVNISYAAPQIGNVTVLREDGTFSSPFSTSTDLIFPTAAFNSSFTEGLPAVSSAGRRRLRRSLSEQGYGLWTSSAFGPCESNILARGLYWRRYAEIAPNGDFRFTFKHYLDGDCSSTTNQTFVVVVQGSLTDLGPMAGSSPMAACGLSRVYLEDTASVTVTILSSSVLDQFFAGCSCVTSWAVGVPITIPQTCVGSTVNCPLLASVYGAEYSPGVSRYGAYIVSNDADIYLAKTVKSLDRLQTMSAIRFPDMPTASVQPAIASLVSSTPKGPTDGCFVWEPIRDYLERANTVSKATGIAISQIPRNCEQRALLEISGSNFGVPLTPDQLLDADPSEPPSLRVFFVPDDPNLDPFEASTVISPGSHKVICPSPDCFQTHTKIRFWIPYGLGKSLRIRVHVGDQAEYATTRFSYLPPRIQEMNPGTVRSGRKFQNALGENVLVRGYNFGGRATPTAVLINGRPCLNPVWDSGSSADTDGRPFLTCDAPVDVVGPKSVMICIAGQLSVEQLFRTDGPVLLAGEAVGAWDTNKPFTMSFASQLRSMSLSRCPPGTTGRLYELCIDCPVGATCEDGSFSGPKSDKYFFDYQIPTRNADGNVTDRARSLCPSTSWNNTLLGEYPDLVQRDTCSAFVGCEPKTACLGSSQCDAAYEYAQPLCLVKRGYGNMTAFYNLQRSDVASTPNSCNVTLNPYTFEYEGVDSDCRGSLGSQDTCTSDHPEQCAKCTVFKDGANSYFGACECTLPQRCSLCTIGTHYRMNNECVPCPQNPGLLIGGLFAAAFLVAALGWYLQREQVNLAFITIGVDYFQVLAIFAATKVPWPKELIALFNIMSVFNFNIDITAPECLVPNLDYEVKWWLQMALPLALAAVLSSIYFGYTLLKMIRWGVYQSHVYTSHLSALIAIFIIAMYYLYLVLTKRALEVFNCNPVDPDDGFLYTSFTSLHCDGGGLCRCGEPGGPQVRLTPFAILFLVLYTFGYPAYIAFTLRRKSLLVREDQYLRAYGVGYVRKTNPDCYDMRKRYSKLYYQFKPRFASFWILVLLVRKFWIAFAFILFRGNPSFQLAVVLLVLFGSIVFQVLWRPYLSTGDRPDIVRELDAMAERSVKEPAFAEYREIQKRVQECMTLDVELRRRMKQTKQGAQLFSAATQDSGKNLGLALSSKKEKVSRSVAAARWFTNLNTLEFILLGCGIIVCLAGIMFEASARDKRALVQGQVAAITWLVVVTIVMSFVYYFLFFLGEVSPACVSSLLSLCKKKEDKPTDEYYDPNINLEENPMFAAPKVEFADNRVLQAELDTQLAQLKLAEQQNRRLRDELKNKKMEAQLDETAKQKATGLEEVRPTRQRKDFAQTRLTAALVGPNRQRARGGNRKVAGEEDEEEEEDIEASVRPKTGLFPRMSLSMRPKAKPQVRDEEQ